LTTYEGARRGAGLRIAVVVSRFNELVTGLLLEGALDGLPDLGVDQDSVTVAHVPGAFELPLVAQRLASTGDHDAVICLGAVIRGETDHHIHVGGQAAAGCQRVQLDTGIPVVLGVLTTDTLEQALARAGSGPQPATHTNKGHDAAMAAVEMVDLLRQLPKAEG
jgi:6,7-dimethyl-8-ribityllumazine synthase